MDDPLSEIDGLSNLIFKIHGFLGTQRAHSVEALVSSVCVFVSPLRLKSTRIARVNQDSGYRFCSHFNRMTKISHLINYMYHFTIYLPLDGTLIKYMFYLLIQSSQLTLNKEPFTFGKATVVPSFCVILK